MALCARVALLLLLGALQVLALPGAAVNSADPQETNLAFEYPLGFQLEVPQTLQVGFQGQCDWVGASCVHPFFPRAGSPSGNDSVPLLTANVNVTENTTVHMAPNQTDEVKNSTVKPLVTSDLPRNVTAGTMKPSAIAKISTPGVSPHVTSTASKSAPKTSASPNSTKTAASMMTTGHSSLKTSVTITAAVHSDKSKGSKFDTSSFVGGIVLTLGVLSILYIGCRMYYSRRGIRYRSIDEHDAII